ncbi:MAG: serine hydrolase [Thiofilum sp.]|uniref:serine hydrolase domain-containing protein n=1 Tax=Thiofilum sp. TaxID=2212733 RepID=UPI0025F380A0|nr:serine hydrolase [Thiofilum sp.]MBK8452740.1 serine hydrolase [Thiofilum sp.]
MKKSFLFTLLSASVLLANSAYAKINQCDLALEPLCNKIDSIIQPSELVGSSIAIMDGEGKLSYATFNTTPEGEKITFDMKFEIGSITKTFTAARILQLIDEGKLTFDTAVSEVLPSSEVTFSQKLPGSLTIGSLLRMDDGLYDYAASYRIMSRDLSAFWPMRYMTSGGYIPNDKEPKFGQLCYGSTGTLLLGLVIDKLNGGNGLGKEPLVNSLREGLFKPAGLENTAMGGYEKVFPISSCTNTNYFDTVKNTPPKRCPNSESYLFTGSGTSARDSKTSYLSYAGPAGGMISTSGDIARWFNWLFTQGPGPKMAEQTKLIGERLTDKDPMITWSKCNQDPWPYPDPKLKKLEYGLILEVSTLQYGDKTVKVYSYTGGSMSFSSYVLYIPELKMSASILFNNLNNPTEKFPHATIVQITSIADLIIEHTVAGGKK